MGTILQKIILFIALTAFLGTVVYAEENRSSQLNKIVDKFGDYGKIASQQKTTSPKDTEPIQTKNTEVDCTQTERMRLIKANILNVQIVAALYAFSLIIIIILMWRTDHQARDIVTIVGLVSVIFATLLLVLMIADTQQLIAPIGIFGAIAGYLFGTAPKKENPKVDSKE